MNPTMKKVLIWSGVGLALIVIYVVYKKETAATTILPLRTQVPGTPNTSATIENMAENLFKSAFSSGSNLSLGVNLTTNGKGGISTTAGAAVKTLDPNTGAYQTANGWFLKDGTALTQYDTTNGTYQETDGSWYTFDGTALSFYDPSTGDYVEESDPTDEYNNSGTVINNNYTV